MPRRNITYDIAFVPAFLRTHPDDMAGSATKFSKEVLENLAQKDSARSGQVTFKRDLQTSEYSE